GQAAVWGELPTHVLTPFRIPVPEDPVSGLVEEMVRRMDAGDWLAAEEILARNPELAENSEAVLRLIYEECCLREEKGEAISREELLQRFPRWRGQLQALLDCHQLLMPGPPSAEELRREIETQGRFVIKGELGRGTNGPVFLATQPDLADR